MPSVEAVAAQAVKTGQLTEDNKNIVLELEVASGSTAVAIPVSESRRLLQILLTLLARSERVTKNNPDLKFPLLTDYWEVGNADDGDVVITFMPQASAELSFRLKRANAANMGKMLADKTK
jgi:hypothetical protein